MRKAILKALTNKQLATLAHYVSIEQLFREYQRKQKWAKKHPMKSVLSNLTADELKDVLEEQYD